MRTICKRLFLFFAALLLLLAGITAYLWHGAANCVPVLNYHQINDTENNALTVKVEQFDKQMQYLADNGYHTITPADMLDCWENGKQLPDKPVIITFDDGYRDNYINAFPILEKYGLKASIFLITDYVSLYPNYVTWDMAKEMQESGLIDLESHTLSHTELTGLESSEDVVRQLQESRNALQYRLGKPAFFIAYPCGSYDDRLSRGLHCELRPCFPRRAEIRSGSHSHFRMQPAYLPPFQASHRPRASPLAPQHLEDKPSEQRSYMAVQPHIDAIKTEYSKQKGLSFVGTALFSSDKLVNGGIEFFYCFLVPFLHRIHNAVLQMVLQYCLCHTLQGSVHSRNLDQHLATVPAVLHHPADGLHMPDDAGHAVQHGLRLGMGMDMPMTLPMGMRMSDHRAIRQDMLMLRHPIIPFQRSHLTPSTTISPLMFHSFVNPSPLPYSTASASTMSRM